MNREGAFQVHRSCPNMACLKICRLYDGWNSGSEKEETGEVRLHGTFFADHRGEARLVLAEMGSHWRVEKVR